MSKQSLLLFFTVLILDILKVRAGIFNDENFKMSNDKICILAIGNSFSEDAIEQNLYELCQAEGIDIIIGNMAIGDCSLQTHNENLENNKYVYSYRKITNGLKKKENNQSLADIISDEDWDFITFQQVSGLSGLYQTYEPYLSNLIKWAKENSNAEILFHQTWSYQSSSKYAPFSYYEYDQMVMYDAIMESTKKVLYEHPEIKNIIPSGTAIQNARSTSIGDNLNRDGYHLELTYGRYTAACTWFEIVTGMDVTQNDYFPDTIDLNTKMIVQHCAHEAILNPFNITYFNPTEQIILNVISANLNIGETILIEATVIPEDTSDKTITWNSSDPNVASVSKEGLVSAISPGEALITATCGEVSAECAITVLEDSGIESLLANPENKITVYSTEGILIKKDCKVEDLKTLNKGIYIIVSGKDRYKISL